MAGNGNCMIFTQIKINKEKKMWSSTSPIWGVCIVHTAWLSASGYNGKENLFVLLVYPLYYESILGVV